MKDVEYSFFRDLLDSTDCLHGQGANFFDDSGDIGDEGQNSDVFLGLRWCMSVVDSPAFTFVEME